MKYHTILFDLDGTLTDPYGGLTSGFIYAFKKMGVDYGKRASLTKYIGPPLTEFWMKDFGWDEEKARRAVEYFREYFGIYGWWDNKLYDGVISMLEGLKALGLRIALATSKPEVYAVSILRHFGLYDYFDAIGAATKGPPRENKTQVIEYVMSFMGIENKDKDGVILIGDTKYDMEGARECGIDFLPVLYGYGKRSDFIGFSVFASTPDDVLKIFLEQ